jgi:CRP-like cAMP-binding protein
MNAPEINLAHLFRRAENVKEYAAGATIFKEGDAAEGMFVIVEGDVDILVGGNPVDTLHAGAIVGEMALLNNAPRSATAVAKTACKAVPVGERQFSFMVQETPNFALHVMRVLSSRLRHMDHVHAK